MVTNVAGWRDRLWINGFGAAHVVQDTTRRLAIDPVCGIAVDPVHTRPGASCTTDRLLLACAGTFAQEPETYRRAYPSQLTATPPN